MILGGSDTSQPGTSSSPGLVEKKGGVNNDEPEKKEEKSETKHDKPEIKEAISLTPRRMAMLPWIQPRLRNPALRRRVVRKTFSTLRR